MAFQCRGMTGTDNCCLDTRWVLSVIKNRTPKESLSGMLLVPNHPTEQVNDQACLSFASVWNLNSSNEGGLTVAFAGKLSSSIGDLGSQY